MRCFRLNQRNSTSSKQDLGKSPQSIPMAFHGSLQNADSEICLENTILEDDPKHNKKLDSVKDWLKTEVTIPDVVWRGTKVREIKPKPDKTQHECFVPDVDFMGSFVKQPRERRGHLGASRKNTRPISTPRSRCACIRPTPAASTYLTINSGSRMNIIKIVPKTKTKNGKRCPLRIAELAVPTKRQCIDTWRNKSDILPVNMIDRLKQRVMDQTPIAGIPDAIYCFQSGRRVSPKKCSFRWLPSMHKSNDFQRPSRKEDTRILCIVFAHRVAKRLSIRLNLALNSNLQNLSNIVSSDIAKIMYKSQCLFGKDQEYKAIHTDVSNTITVWITGILGDLSDRLLEEELRVKNDIEAQQKAQIETMLEFDERFTAIIDTIKEQENKQSKDLEEEEGPVLDFIDDVVHNVLNICDPPQPPQLHDDSDSSSSCSCHDLLEEESEKLLEALDKKEIFNSAEFVPSFGENEEAVTDNHNFFTDSEHFRNEIIYIIDNITKESEDGRSNDSEVNMENEGILFKSDRDHDINISNYEEVSRNAEMENDINDGNNEEISPIADMEHDINDGNNEEISSDADMEHTINDGNNEEISPIADMEHDINDGNNEEISSDADMEHTINEGNNEEISPIADMEHDINDGNNEEISSDADMEYTINDGNNEEISPIADMEHDINDGNNEEVLSNADMEHDINDGNNEEVSPNSDMEHDINDGNNEEVSPNADMEYAINDGNNEEVSPNADMEHDINDGNSEEVSPNADMEHDLNDGNIEEVSAKTEVEHNLNDENIDQIDDDSQNLKENDDANDNLEETRSNVSERLEIFTDDIDDDKNNKKVMFPNTDLVNPDNPADQINTSTAEKPAPTSDEYKHPRWNSQTNKPNIIFSEPNQDLLSDADESWPDDLSYKLAVKVSETASKSVLSLGNITEYDEKPMTSQQEEDSMTNKATDDTILQANDILKKIDSKLPTEKHRTASLGYITEHHEKRMTSQQEEEDIMTNKATDDTILQANDIMKKIDNKLPTEKHRTASLGYITEHHEKRMTSQQEEEDSMTNIATDDTILQANDIMKKIDNKLPTEKHRTASLGYITEHHEKRMTSQQEEEDSMTNKATDDTILQANDIMKKIDNKLPTEKHSTASLGNITEHHEKRMTSQEKDSKTEIGTGDAILQANDIMKKRDNKLPTEKHGKVSQSNEPMIKVSIESSSSEPSFTKSVSKIKKGNDKTITDPKTTKYSEHQTDSGESEFKRTESSTEWTEDDKIPRQKSPPLSLDYGWKVHPKTAPSWVTASMWGRGRGEPSEDSIPIQIKPTLVKESELRKWCKSLQDAFINLEMWRGWISATCKETIFLLKQKESACPGLVQRAAINWSKFKRNVRKDALLWTKLYQRTNTNFQNLKMKYDNVEIVAAECRAMCICVNTKH